MLFSLLNQPSRLPPLPHMCLEVNIPLVSADISSEPFKYLSWEGKLSLIVFIIPLFKTKIPSSAWVYVSPYSFYWGIFSQ